MHEQNLSIFLPITMYLLLDILQPLNKLIARQQYYLLLKLLPYVSVIL